MRHDGSDPEGEAIAAPRPAVAPGDRLKDRYDVVALIGSGGMADVFEGIDALFQRDVAIKVLKPARVDEVMKRRVLREARASCAVDHPHMLRITDMGLAGDAPYIVSDLLRGRTLAEELRVAQGGRIDWRRAVRLLLPAMAALHMAHEAGLVHRDIKPENLFVHRRRGEEVLIVLDLGIVKYVNLDGTRARWTRSGMILGTAMYMAPEQVNAGLVDRRTDVYAMGVTLYRLLSGQHMFPTPTADGAIAAMSKHLFEPPPRLAGRRFPRALIEAVYAAVAKEPDGRHASMADFAAVLAACLADDAARATSVRRALHGVSLVGLGVAGTVLGLRVSEVLLATPEEVTTECASAASCEPVAASCAATAAIVTPDVAPTTTPGPAADAGSGPSTVTSESVAAAPISPGPVVGGGSPGRSRTSPGRAAPGTRRGPGRPGDGLARANAAVQQCLRAHADQDTRSLSVRVSVRTDGSVASTEFVGPYAASFLGACVRREIAGLRFAAGTSRTLEHTYQRAENTRHHIEKKGEETP